jgi:phage gpG-like protein
MTADQLLRNIINDLRVELAEEFDRNFERKAFFSKKWNERKLNGKGSLLNVKGGGGLRGSQRAKAQGNTIRFTSSLPYAAIHNEGGRIKITPKMHRFFWAKYYEYSGAVKYKKNGTKGQNKRNVKLSKEAEFYKSLALKKVGDYIVIPQRQYIGAAPEVDACVKRVIDANLKDIESYLKKQLQPKT